MATELWPRGTTIGYRYIVKGMLGGGGNSQCIRAVHCDLGDQVAIKTVHPLLLSRRPLGHALRALQDLITEGRVMAQFRHRNILAARDLFCSPPDLAMRLTAAMRLQAGASAQDANRALRDLEQLVTSGMAYAGLVVNVLPGMTCASLLDGTGRLEETIAARIIAEILEALVEVHRQGVVHGDIKPSNVMIGSGGPSRGQITLFDFGRCRPINANLMLHEEECAGPGTDDDAEHEDDSSGMHSTGLTRAGSGAAPQMGKCDEPPGRLQTEPYSNSGTHAGGGHSERSWPRVSSQTCGAQLPRATTVQSVNVRGGDSGHRRARAAATQAGETSNGGVFIMQLPAADAPAWGTPQQPITSIATSQGSSTVGSTPWPAPGGPQSADTIKHAGSFLGHVAAAARKASQSGEHGSDGPLDETETPTDDTRTRTLSGNADVPAAVSVPAPRRAAPPPPARPPPPPPVTTVPPRCSEMKPVREPSPRVSAAHPAARIAPVSVAVASPAGAPRAARCEPPNRVPISKSVGSAEDRIASGHRRTEPRELARDAPRRRSASLPRMQRPESMSDRARRTFATAKSDFNTSVDTPSEISALFRGNHVSAAAADPPASPAHGNAGERTPKPRRGTAIGLAAADMVARLGAGALAKHSVPAVDAFPMRAEPSPVFSRARARAPSAERHSRSPLSRSRHSHSRHSGRRGSHNNDAKASHYSMVREEFFALGAGPAVVHAGGNLDYAAPEVLRGDLRVDVRSDLWSVGLIAFELAAGFHPFKQSQDQAANVLIDDPKDARHVEQTLANYCSPAFAAAVAKALAADPRKRYASAEDMLDAFRALAPCTACGGQVSAEQLRGLAATSLASPMGSRKVRATRQRSSLRRVTTLSGAGLRVTGGGLFDSGASYHDSGSEAGLVFPTHATTGSHTLHRYESSTCARPGSPSENDSDICPSDFPGQAVGMRASLQCDTTTLPGVLPAASSMAPAGRPSTHAVPVPVTEDTVRTGLLVTRGKDWAWGPQDGGEGSEGVVLWEEARGWWRVVWPRRQWSANCYRVGGEGCYDLQSTGQVREDVASVLVPEVGSYVVLAPSARLAKAPWELRHGEVGKVVEEDTGESSSRRSSEDAPGRRRSSGSNGRKLRVVVCGGHGVWMSASALQVAPDPWPAFGEAVTMMRARAGLRVDRGPGWRFGGQGGPEGTQGVLDKPEDATHWWVVWDHDGSRELYEIPWDTWSGDSGLIFTGGSGLLPPAWRELRGAGVGGASVAGGGTPSTSTRHARTAALSRHGGAESSHHLVRAAPRLRVGASVMPAFPWDVAATLALPGATIRPLGDEVAGEWAPGFRLEQMQVGRVTAICQATHSLTIALPDGGEGQCQPSAVVPAPRALPMPGEVVTQSTALQGLRVRAGPDFDIARRSEGTPLVSRRSRRSMRRSGELATIGEGGGLGSDEGLVDSVLSADEGGENDPDDLAARAAMMRGTLWGPVHQALDSRWWVVWDDGSVSKHAIGAGGRFELAFDTRPSRNALPSVDLADPAVQNSASLRGGRQIVLGTRVMLSPDFAQHPCAVYGPLRPGEVGVIVDDDPDSALEVLVQPAQGRKWWYARAALEPAPTPFPVAGAPVRIRSARAGLSVRRGPSWKWADQDGGLGGVGVLVAPARAPGWWRVHWFAPGVTNAYRVGAEGASDLEFLGGVASLPDSVACFGEALQPGEHVMISWAAADASNGLPGPLHPGRVGVVIAVDDSICPVKVMSHDGSLGWYRASDLQRAPALLPEEGQDVTDEDARAGMLVRRRVERCSRGSRASSRAEGATPETLAAAQASLTLNPMQGSVGELVRPGSTPGTWVVRWYCNTIGGMHMDTSEGLEHCGTPLRWVAGDVEAATAAGLDPRIAEGLEEIVGAMREALMESAIERAGVGEGGGVERARRTLDDPWLAPGRRFARGDAVVLSHRATELSAAMQGHLRFACGGRVLKVRDVGAGPQMVLVRPQTGSAGGQRAMRTSVEAQRGRWYPSWALDLIPDGVQPGNAVSAENAVAGLLVRPGPGWRSIVPGIKVGTVGRLARPGARHGWWLVQWPTGDVVAHAVGAGDVHELEIAARIGECAHPRTTSKNAEVPQAFRGLKKGMWVELTPSGAWTADAAHGPLKGPVIGSIVDADSPYGPFRVKTITGKHWWYDAEALRPLFDPETLRGQAVGEQFARRGLRVAVGPDHPHASRGGSGVLLRGTRPGIWEAGWTEHGGVEKVVTYRTGNEGCFDLAFTGDVDPRLGRLEWALPDPDAVAALRPPFAPGTRVMLRKRGLENLAHVRNGPLVPGATATVVEDFGGTQFVKVRLTEEDRTAAVMAVTERVSTYSDEPILPGRAAPTWAYARGELIAWPDPPPEHDDIVTPANARFGLRVRRGPDWKWGMQDRGRTGLLVKSEDPSNEWWRVEWNNGTGNAYRVGHEGFYDLVYHLEDDVPVAEEAKLCTLCCEAPRGARFAPCSHATCCMRCADECKTRGLDCPLCKAPIEAIVACKPTDSTY
ncbi:unnamed protein product [Pedinophyceae sp. YPF-701]|nr:unnamed protein product [Pedinophyceae sp. YPF-701]